MNSSLLLFMMGVMLMPNMECLVLPSKPCGQRRFKQQSLEMSSLSTAASIATVASVVAFHEAGHLLAAKIQNMKVQSYNVGYGPKLYSFNDTSDTEYALRLIPLGGYVAFPANAEYDDEGEVIKELDDPDLLQNRPPLQRALVISAGQCPGCYQELESSFLRSHREHPLGLHHQHRGGIQYGHRPSCL